MGSLPGAVVGALLLGVAESMTVTYISPQWATAVPYVVIFVVLLGAPAGAARARGCVRTWRRYEPRPCRGRRWTWLRRRALASSLLLFPVVSDDLYYQNMIILSLVFAIGAVGLNIISGYGGYVSLGQGAFLGIGAYTVGAAVDPTSDVSPFGLRCPLAGVVGGGRSRRCSASIAMRTRGHAFVILTIAFLFLLQLVAAQLAVAHRAAPRASRCRSPLWTRASRTGRSTTRSSALLALSLLMSWRIRRTKFGMGLIAMREDEDKAATVGINTPSTRCSASSRAPCSSAWRARVYGYYLTFIDPRGMFDIVHQRADRAVDAARRPRDAVGAGARRVPHRAAQRVRQQQSSAAATRAC